MPAAAAEVAGSKTDAADRMTTNSIGESVEATTAPKPTAGSIPEKDSSPETALRSQLAAKATSASK